MKPQTIHLEALLIFFLTLLIFIIGQFNHEFVGFESRFALFVQEMLRNGISFFPTTYDKPYPDYPATQTILIDGLATIADHFNIIVAILPSAIACALTALLTFLIGESCMRSWGLYAVMFELFTFGFLDSARTISLDAFTLLATTFCFWSIYSLKQWGWITLGLVIGFVFRGPIGLVIPAAVVGVFYLLERDFKRFLFTSLTSIILLALGMLGLLAAAQYQGGPSFVHEVITMQVTGRMANAANTKPFYYYGLSALSDYALSFPIALLVIAATIPQWLKKPLNPSIKLLRHCAGWLAIILIGLSIPGGKKIRYLLPIVPAASLIAAYTWLDQDHRLLQQLRQLLKIICFVLPLLSLAALVGYTIWTHYKPLSLEGHFTTAEILLGLFSVATLFIIPKISHKKAQDYPLFFLGLATFITLIVLIVQPIHVQLNRAKPFAQEVKTLRTANQTIIFYGITEDGDAIKFMVAYEQPLKPLFFEKPEQIVNFDQLALFITTQKLFNALPHDIKTHLKVLYEGKLGHQPCIVFSK